MQNALLMAADQLNTVSKSERGFCLCKFGNSFYYKDVKSGSSKELRWVALKWGI